ncbi:DUF1214 domain-containing protein [Sphingomonas sp. KC8]|uniref:DUF1214 domain-containing protein n=1 Tax=Sphingomonas sp. KC8 TaxID=1030157 RepID=UPI00024885B7|nr:DUF1214 domain-containing protein [Sphingomonas sp. KC8]ARS25786.1 hypothetical protein KC8_00560 [Sphingomonas sp. KC8]
MSEDKVMSGEVWRDFCRKLEKAGDVVLGAEAAATPIDRAEGYRYLTRLLRIALEMNLEFADPDFPAFYQASHQTAKIGADNPDNHYLNATVTGDRSYRISGKRGTVPILTFGSKANRYAIDGTMASTGEVDVEDMLIEADGSFELIASRERPGNGNWLPIAEDTSMILVRQTFGDRAKEQGVDIRIEAIDGPATPAPLTPERLETALGKVAGFVEGTARTFAIWAEKFRAENMNALDTPDQAMFVKAGGDPMIHYLHGAWELAPDEALVIETTVPKCRVWNFQLDNYWMESLDYRFHQIHYNNTSAKPNSDGTVTLVIAARDPGFGNWVDTAGHAHGTMLWRWTDAAETPIPTTKVIKLP